MLYKQKGVGNLDKRLFETLYQQYFQELYLYVYSLCGQKSMTEDILQETFLKAFTALKDSHTNMRAWLYMVARNLCCNWMKKEKRLILSEHTGLPENASGRHEDILKTVVGNEERRLLWEALQQLSYQKREILVLQYFGGFRQKEIAAMLKITPENVRVLAYRAKKELKTYLEVKGYDI